jgi:hypothetical protein
MLKLTWNLVANHDKVWVRVLLKTKYGWGPNALPDIRMRHNLFKYLESYFTMFGMMLQILYLGRFKMEKILCSGRIDRFMILLL